MKKLLPSAVFALFLVSIQAFASSAATPSTDPNTVSACIDHWNKGAVMGRTCHALAVAASFKGDQLAINQASSILFYGAQPGKTLDIQELISAIQQTQQAVDSVEGIISNFPPETRKAVTEYGAGSADPFSADFQQMQAAFSSNKWPVPKNFNAGFNWMVAQLKAPYHPDALAIGEVASQTATSISSDLSTYRGNIVVGVSAGDKLVHQEAVDEANVAYAKAHSSYFEHVKQRFSGTGADAGSGDWTGLFSLLVFTGIVALFYFTRAVRRGMHPRDAMRGALLWALVPCAAWLLLFLLYTVTGWPPSHGEDFPIAFVILCALFTVAGSRYLRRWFKGTMLASHGSARWASLKDAMARGRIGPRGYVPTGGGCALGRVDAKKDMDPRFRYMGHVLTCAPTGAGKGVGAVIPNLLDYPGSAIVLDVKGENYAVSARARQELGQAVFVVDPFHITGNQAHRFNWLDLLDPTSPDVVADSATLADMIVIPGKGDEGNYWDEAAKDFLQGVMVYVASLPDPGRRNMGEVRALLTADEDGFADLLAEMKDTRAGFGTVQRAANTLLSKADRNRQDVMASIHRHTAFLDDPRIAEALSASDFTLADIKAKQMTVYLAMPPARLATNARFIRGFIGLALNAITRTNETPEYRVAFMLDEFAQLGRIAAIEDGISLVRGYGAAFWIFVQDLSQLRGVYPKWQTFLANSAKQFFGTADFDTARYISDSLGQFTMKFRTGSQSNHKTRWQDGNTGQSEQLTGRSLLTPDEVMRLGSRPIVLIPGELPYLLGRLNYLVDPEYVGLADANPFHT